MTFDYKVRAFIPVVIVLEAVAALRRKVKRHLLFAKFAAYKALGNKPERDKPRPRVVAAVVHITSTEEHHSPEAGKVKVERLAATLDGLLCSFAHCELRVLIVTMRQRHVVHFLPDHLRQAVEMHIVESGDPMFIGYQAQDALIAQRDAHDWFLFLEDDIEIRDASFLDKASRFCALPGTEHCVLMPNRFEYVERVKRYIDLTLLPHTVSWNPLSRVVQDGNIMAECSNPHAGMFCLSRRQIDMLVASGRQWRGQVLVGGSRESAATFSLLECFRLYKPHADNFYYLEVRHVDSKYSLMHPDMSEYTFTAIPIRPAAAS